MLVQSNAAAVKSQIVNTFGTPITQQVQVQVSGAVANATGGYSLRPHAEGGRSDVPALFGEAGAEWAIPERHTERTANLLASAAKASGFTWGELISRTGGLNAGDGSRSETFIYSPTIYASDASGVSGALQNSKADFEKWWRERNARERAEVYA